MVKNRKGIKPKHREAAEAAEAAACSKTSTIKSTKAAAKASAKAPSATRGDKRKRDKVSTSERDKAAAERAEASLDRQFAALREDPFRTRAPPCCHALHHPDFESSSSTSATTSTAASDDHTHIANCHGNPNCLYGLGEHTLGIWSKEVAPLIVKRLGTKPSARIRTPGTPVGLVNLGATCYVNSLLQVLFFDIEFRNALYKWRPVVVAATAAAALSNTTSSTSHHSRSRATSTSGRSGTSSSSASRPASPSESIGVRIARELQMLFGHLQLGQQKSFNPQAFVKTLQLPTSVQQDAQEFNKLLLSKLEDTFNLSSDASVRNFIPDRYGGQLSHCTKCLECKHTSRRKEAFYELGLSSRQLMDQLYAVACTGTPVSFRALSWSTTRTLAPAEVIGFP